MSPLNSSTFGSDRLLRGLFTVIVWSRSSISKVSIIIVTRQLLESLPLRLRDAQSGKDAQEHEQRVDLHDVVLPWACTSF
jgi:hypothetical protein